MGQQKDKDSDLLIAVLLAGLVLGIVGGLAIAGIAYPIYQSEKWAAWVQAFGSIGAIVAAIYIMEKGRKHQGRVKQLHDDEAVKSAANSIITALSTIYNIERSLQESWRLGEGFIPLEVIVRLPLETAKRVTDQIPWYSPPYTKILHMADALQGLEVALYYYSTREFPNDSITNSNEFCKALKKAKKLKDEAKRKMDQYAEVAGIDFNS